MIGETMTAASSAQAELSLFPGNVGFVLLSIHIDTHMNAQHWKLLNQLTAKLISARLAPGPACAMNTLAPELTKLRLSLHAVYVN